MMKMKKENKNLELLKPTNFSTKDPMNPDNIDAEKALNKARKKRTEDLTEKIVIVNGKEKK